LPDPDHFDPGVVSKERPSARLHANKQMVGCKPKARGFLAA
jgi:hypothetical protein